MPGMSDKGDGVVMEPFKRGTHQKGLLPLVLIGSLVLGGCFPPKTVISLPGPPRAVKSKEAVPEKKSPSEEEVKAGKTDPPVGRDRTQAFRDPAQDRGGLEEGGKCLPKNRRRGRPDPKGPGEDRGHRP